MKVSFYCEEDAFSEKTFKRQARIIDRTVAKIRKILPKSSATEKLESKRRFFQSSKNSPASDFSAVEPGFSCSEDDD